MSVNKYVVSFLHLAFPIKKRTILLGLSYGALLVAIYWFPFPTLLEKIDFPDWMGYILALAIVCIIFWSFLSGRVLVQEAGIIGWTAIGHLAFSIILVVLSRGKFGGSLISALCLLAIYVTVTAFRISQKE